MGGRVLQCVGQSPNWPGVWEWVSHQTGSHLPGPKVASHHHVLGSLRFRVGRARPGLVWMSSAVTWCDARECHLCAELGGQGCWSYRWFEALGLSVVGHLTGRSSGRGVSQLGTHTPPEHTLWAMGLHTHAMRSSVWALVVFADRMMMMSIVREPVHCVWLALGRREPLGLIPPSRACDTTLSLVFDCSHAPRL